MAQATMNTFLSTAKTYFLTPIGIIRGIVVCAFGIQFIITLILGLILGGLYITATLNRSSVGFYTFICFCLVAGSITFIIAEILDLNTLKPYKTYILLIDVIGYSIAIFFVFCTAVSSTLYAALIGTVGAKVITGIVALFMWFSLAGLIAVLVYLIRYFIQYTSISTTTTTTTTITTDERADPV